MTEIPLYNGAEIKERLEKRPSTANTGLWYDKFCNQWPSNWGRLEDSKKIWIETVTGEAIGNKDEIETNIRRMKKMIEFTSGRPLQFRNESRFVTGLGKNHPVENGFTWHHTLGVPYIPGTSVKGIIRDWARQNGEDKSKINRLFGPDDNQDRSVGSIIFLDALPTHPVVLSSDIMTPHYGPYYSNGEEIPGDWHDPIPIPFLTVDKDQVFLFGIIPRIDVAEEEIDEVSNWLIQALEWFGAGAKTNVEYGRFKHLEVKSPADQWIMRISREQEIEIDDLTSKCPNVLMEELEKVEDEHFKKQISLKLKATYSEKLWTFGGIGSGKKLVKALKEYLGD